MNGYSEEFVQLVVFNKSVCACIKERNPGSVLQNPAINGNIWSSRI